jgi:hypothetical protein
MVFLVLAMPFLAFAVAIAVAVAVGCGCYSMFLSLWL